MFRQALLQHNLTTFVVPGAEFRSLALVVGALPTELFPILKCAFFLCWKLISRFWNVFLNHALNNFFLSSDPLFSSLLGHAGHALSSVSCFFSSFSSLLSLLSTHDLSAHDFIGIQLLLVAFHLARIFVILAGDFLSQISKTSSGLARGLFRYWNILGWALIVWTQGGLSFHLTWIAQMYVLSVSSLSHRVRFGIFHWGHHGA